MESGRGWSPPALGGAVLQIPVGGIILYAGKPSDALVRATLAVQGWLWCDGGYYSVDAYSQLFAVIGYTYGGEAVVFCVPDLRTSTVSVPGAEQNYLIRYCSLPALYRLPETL